jgi:hypothetical protein
MDGSIASGSGVRQQVKDARLVAFRTHPSLKNVLGSGQLSCHLDVFLYIKLLISLNLILKFALHRLQYTATLHAVVVPCAWFAPDN